MAGIYGISNYSLTGNYGYGYSTGAVSADAVALIGRNLDLSA